MVKKSESKIVRRKKNAWVAGILNFIFPGLGYLYVGKRKIFALGLILSSIFLIIDALISETEIVNGSFIGFIASIIMLFAFGYDAYKETKR